LAAADGTVRYRIPPSLRAALPARRVLLADDAVNAGSALLSTSEDLRACGAEPAGFASLLTLGEAAAQIAAQHGAPFFALLSLDRGMWPADACALCAAGVPLIDRLAKTLVRRSIKPFLRQQPASRRGDAA
jgi:orotate phosphoribosyltransferase